MTADLKPCPMCGSIKVEQNFGDESACYRCRDCGCQSGRVYFTEAERESDDFSESEASALEAWNRRTASAEPSPEANVDTRIDRQLRNFQKHDPSLDRELLDEAAKTNAVLADRAVQMEARGLPPLSENAVLHAVTMAQTDAYKKGDLEFWFALAERLRAQWNCMPPVAAQADARREDGAMLDFVEKHRVSVIPEFEGPWDAAVYGDDGEPKSISSGKTPREAILAAMNTTKGADHAE